MVLDVFLGSLCAYYFYTTHAVERIVRRYPNTSNYETSIPLSGTRQRIAAFTTADPRDAIVQFYKMRLWSEGEWELGAETETYLQFNRFVQANPGGSPVQGYSYALELYLEPDQNSMHVELYYRYRHEIAGDM